MSGHDDLLKARICELLESWQPWQRRLWDLGTVLALREAVEAADWVSRQVLSPAATSWYARESLLPRLGTDAAIRDGQVRRQLNEVCKRPLRTGTRGQRSLDLLADLVEDGYLQRWREVIVSGSGYDVERAAPLTGSSPSTAVAGAWAALESLLFCDTDEKDREEGRAVAADRAAGLVAAGWPRAELTAISYRSGLLDADARLRRALDGAGKENRARVEILVRWLRSRPSLPALEPADLAALHRMRGLVERPRPTLGRVNGHLRGALRRLYRQRNIVLHGGSTRSVALRASLRTAGPLVGAALDRVAHGYAAADTGPLELASRAQLAIAVADDLDGWGLHELLGT